MNISRLNSTRQFNMSAVFSLFSLSSSSVLSSNTHKCSYHADDHTRITALNIQLNIKTHGSPCIGMETCGILQPMAFAWCCDFIKSEATTSAALWGAVRVRV